MLHNRTVTTENEKRALEAIAAVNEGANPTWEAYKLSNEFTDRHTARFEAWFRRVFSKRR